MKYNLMNSVRYGLPKKILCNKMDKNNTIPPIKPNTYYTQGRLIRRNEFS